ncbi:MAG: lipoyl(octanoyl) transferase LipB [Fimbriimonadaceae bacterium]|jgi:lipoate-protein ligase B|nr:lipoyl(octanoyl) transferase LipB [Fimbriimonadaceae bacterium]
MKILDLQNMDYKAAWDCQLDVLETVQNGGDDVLILVEHPPIMTLGANFHEANLLLQPEEYQEKGIQVVGTDRGGDVTYHGPGQLVIYPIFDVARHGKDLHKWMRDLEETMIQVAASYGLSAKRLPPHTGTWIGDRKLAAIGVKIKRWVSIHGIALNCDNTLDEFSLIVPCGIQHYGVTSLTAELGHPVSVDQAKPRVIEAFRNVFSEA